jgi:hypothetical protein
MTTNKNPLSMDSQQQQARVVEGSEIEGGESVLEVGFSRDWAGCEALRADGTGCGDWVDTRHTRVCAWHVDQGMKRARKGRMEYAVGYIPFTPVSHSNPCLSRLQSFFFVHSDLYRRWFEYQLDNVLFSNIVAFCIIFINS